MSLFYRFGGMVAKSAISGSRSEAARELDKLCWNRLNSPEWTREELLEFYSMGSASGLWARKS